MTAPAQHPKQQAAYRMARKHIGMKEVPGAKHNPEIVGMFADVGHSWVKDDETAWCAAFVGAMLERCGLQSTRELNARSYLKWGVKVPLEEAEPGDVAVFWRGRPDSWQGHVAFYVGHGASSVSVVGGNQRNSVSVAPYARKQLLEIRRMGVAVAPRPKAAAKPRGGAALVGALVAAAAGAAVAFWDKIMALFGG